MAVRALVDAGFIVALLSRRDRHHRWATAQASEFELPWVTCDAVLSEAFYLLGKAGAAPLSASLRRRAITTPFSLADNLEATLTLMQKYASVPMSLADACLVRMTETIAEPVVLTTDADFRVYRRHSRQIVPCVLPDRG
jgi:predicted nucleic acid-binding protein